MSAIFGRDYADVYDALYGAKDYAGEADLIERILARHRIPLPCRVLDVGCGTGRHACLLAQRGYDVTGLDRSPFMLAHAREAAQKLDHKPPRFLEADARRFELGERFSVVLMMFTVLGYMYEQPDVLSALACVRAHLEPRGVFIFDVWNGLAVLAQGAKQRTATAVEGSRRVVRTSSTRVEVGRQLCHVHFDVENDDTDGQTKTWSEDHTLRYFLPGELEKMLEVSGLKLLDLRRFPDGELPPDEQAWNVIGMATVQ